MESFTTMDFIIPDAEWEQHDNTVYDIYADSVRAATPSYRAAQRGHNVPRQAQTPRIRRRPTHKEDTIIVLSTISSGISFANSEDDQVRSTIPVVSGEPIESTDDKTIATVVMSSSSSESPDGEPITTVARIRKRRRPSTDTESVDSRRPKQRTRTGCKTCRKRKKKCDEGKPECRNCIKGNIVCLGYEPREVFMTTAEREAAEKQGNAEESECQRIIGSPVPLAFCVAGVDTAADRMFFSHYMSRLSPKFTVESGPQTSFQTVILPIAKNNPTLMHEIFYLASQHIDLQSEYGRQLRRGYPGVSMRDLVERSHYHRTQAMTLQATHLTNEQLVAAALQLVLRLMGTLISPANLSGMHRAHLQGLQKLLPHLHPQYREVIAMVSEFNIYHVSADHSTSDPTKCGLLLAPSSVQNVSTGPFYNDSLRLVGTTDDSFRIMEEITNFRNYLRPYMRDPNSSAMCYVLYGRADNIRAAIRDWVPQWPENDPRNEYGVDRLHQLMMMISLLHTICPLSRSQWVPSSQFIPLINQAINILQQIPADSPLQTILLRPIYHIGWAAFFPAQRDAIRKSIKRVRSYMEFCNADAAMTVLEEVWRMTDDRNPGSWDVPNVAHGLGLVFLAT